MNAGVVLIALGELRYVSLALLSIASVRLSGEKRPVSVITDMPSAIWVGRSELDYALIEIAPVAPSADSVARIKTQVLAFSPYERTLLVDADTVFVASPEEIWQGDESLAVALDPCSTIDVVTSACPSWGRLCDWRETQELVGDAALHYNVGVLRIDKTPEMRALCDIWSAEIFERPFPDIDQNAFIRALYRANIKPAVLPARFNAPYRKFHENQAPIRQPVIAHYSGVNAKNRDEAMLMMFRNRFPPLRLSSSETERVSLVFD